jgi:hypothetical protein
LLQNPLNKAFSFRYRVSGPWADATVEKLGHTVDEAIVEAGRREVARDQAAKENASATAKEKSAAEGPPKEGARKEGGTP